MPDHGEHGEEAPAPPLATPEFKAEIVELCQRGDRSAGQVARDFDLTETAVREWVRQAERDAGNREDGGLTSAGRPEEGRAAAGEPAAAGGRGDPEAGHGFLRGGDPVNCYPFIEAEKAQRRNVKRACQLLKVSRAACYAARAAGPRTGTGPTPGSRRGSRPSTSGPRAGTARRGSTPSCVAKDTGAPASGSPV